MSVVIRPFRWETLPLLRRRYFGPSDNYRGLTAECESSLMVNAGIEPAKKIAFVGDIMSVCGKPVRVSERLKLYFADCDSLVGNLEGTITTAEPRVLALRNDPHLLDVLTELMPAENIYLGVANNHSGDFPRSAFEESRVILESKGFTVFGSVDRPYVDITEQIRVVAGTQWSNHYCDFITSTDDVLQYAGQKPFTVLFAHWGHELELFPRPETISQGKKWLEHFDSIIGHHSHVPQPITTVHAGLGSRQRNAAVAYSLGNFTALSSWPSMHYGQAVKMCIGPGEAGLWQTGQMERTYTSCLLQDDGEFLLDILDELPCAEALKPDLPAIYLRKMGLRS